MDIVGLDAPGDQGTRNTSPHTNEEREKQWTATSESDGTSRSTSGPSPNESNGVQSPGSQISITIPRSQSVVSVASLLQRPARGAPRSSSHEGNVLTQKEARLVHYYSEHLGRWLDCTDATRQFTLGVPEKVRLCPVLCHAVLSFAARHCREDATALAAYQQCILLLIKRLNEPSATHDEMLLCSIVVLRFFEQLNGTSALHLRRTILLTSLSTRDDWIRRRTTFGRIFRNIACLSRQSIRRSFVAHASRSCVLGLCSPMPLHGNH